MHSLTRALGRLLCEQRVASMATMDPDDQPQLSLVPFAIDAEAGTLVIHVSALAAHTAALARHPRVALMVHERAPEAGPVHALHRVALQVEARILAPGVPESDALRSIYLARFPEAQPMTELGDFRFVQLRPLGARQVAGFGAARSLGPEELTRAMRLAEQPQAPDVP